MTSRTLAHTFRVPVDTPYTMATTQNCPRLSEKFIGKDCSTIMLLVLY